MLILSAIVLFALCAWYLYEYAASLGLLGSIGGSGILGAIFGTIAGSVAIISVSVLILVDAILFALWGIVLLVLALRLRKHSLWWLLKWLLILGAISCFAGAILDAFALDVLFCIILAVIGVALLAVALTVIGKKGRR